MIQTILAMIVFSCLVTSQVTADVRGNSITGNDGTVTTLKMPQLEPMYQDSSWRRLGENDSHRNHAIEHIKETKPFFSVLLATILVNITTLIGILIVIPLIIEQKWNCYKSIFWTANYQASDRKEDGRVHHDIIDPSGRRKFTLTNVFVPSFVSGAIIATIFFRLVPEAITFIQMAKVGDHDGGEEEEAEQSEILAGTITWFATSLLAGFLFPVILGALFPRSLEHQHNDKSFKDITAINNKGSIETGNTDGNESPDSPVTVATNLDTKEFFDDNVESKAHKKSSANSGSVGRENGNTEFNYRLCQSTLIGNAVHNFCDGIFIGVSFMTCSTATAISIVLFTIYNELSQEVADYFLLTRNAGLSIPRAILLNFLSGLSVIIGGLVILRAGLNEIAIGVILSFAGGVYFNIASSEYLPRVDAVVMIPKDRLLSLFFFVIGTVPIGLTLLKHDHCN